jgi:hypothetical protein
MMQVTDQHEMRARPAHFSAGYHEPEVVRLHVLSAGVEAKSMAMPTHVA